MCKYGGGKENLTGLNKCEGVDTTKGVFVIVCYRFRSTALEKMEGEGVIDATRESEGPREAPTDSETGEHREDVTAGSAVVASSVKPPFCEPQEKTCLSCLAEGRE